MVFEDIMDNHVYSCIMNIFMFAKLVSLQLPIAKTALMDDYFHLHHSSLTCPPYTHAL